MSVFYTACTTKPKSNGRPVSAKKPTPGCYVLSLTVENIRCFGPKTEFSTLKCCDEQGRPSRWTVILGDNGTGKTTLLRMLRFSLYEQMEQWNYPIDGRKGSSGSAISMTAAWGELASSPDRITTASLALDPGNALDGCEQWNRTPVEGDRVLVASMAMFGYDVDRRSFKDSHHISFHFGEHPPPRKESGDVVRDAEEWLIALDYSAGKSGNRQQAQWLEQAKSVLLTVINYDDSITAMRCQPGTGPFPQSRVEFKTADGWLQLRQLGHGYQTMIGWVTDLVSRMVERYPDSENPLAEPAVCLVDEIDLHLHPVWQRKVIGYLSERFPNTQFIVTAHSPLVVQAAASADANIAVLARSTEKDADGNHYVEIRNNPEDVRNWRLDQILTSDLFGGIDLRSVETEKLFARKRELLDKAKLNKVEAAELADIEAKIAELPVGDTKKFKDELQLLRDALDALKPAPHP